MNDLHAALDSIAARATVVATPVAVDRLLRRVHRQRVARAVAASGLAAASVTGVAFAAVGLADDSPAPPAQTTPTPDDTSAPSPTPSVEDAAWPAAVRLATSPTCGEPLPAMENPDPDGSAEVYFFTFVTGWPAVVGEPLALQTTAVIGLDGVELHGRPLAVPHLTIMRDDVVVGMIELGSEVPETLSALVSTGGGPTTEVSPVLTACDGSGPLPAGDYRMVVWQPFAPVAGADVGRPEVATFGGPETLLLAADPEGLRIEPAGTGRMPGCGDPFTLETVDDPTWLVEGQVVVGRLEAGELVADPAGDVLSVWFTSGPQGEPYPMNGWPASRTYLVDAGGHVAFWDDRSLLSDEEANLLWEPVDCRTGERLDGTYRAYHQEVRWPWPGMPAEPPTELVRLPDVTVGPAADG